MNRSSKVCVGLVFCFSSGTGPLTHDLVHARHLLSTHKSFSGPFYWALNLRDAVSHTGGLFSHHDGKAKPEMSYGAVNLKWITTKIQTQDPKRNRWEATDSKCNWEVSRLATESRRLVAGSSPPSRLCASGVASCWSFFFFFSISDQDLDWA